MVRRYIHINAVKNSDAPGGTLPVVQLFRPVDRANSSAHHPTLVMIVSLRAVLFWLVLWMTASPVVAAEPWQAALSRMALATNVRELNRTHCLEILLQSFASNDLVKALVFMP